MIRKPTAVRGAFTLIELLIVVAIIAILAAIAVPNFLEAQVRAKVSRVKSDQRTIATALESYRVDNQAYPEQGETTSPTPPTVTDINRVFGQEGQRAIAFRLSTPIAYVSSTNGVFADVFFSSFGKNGTSVVNDTRYFNYSGDYAKGRCYDSTQDGSAAAFLTLSEELGQINSWHLRSRGPDGDYERRSDGWADLILYRGKRGTPAQNSNGIRAYYDPTNGTASGGDIARFGREGIAN